MFFPRPCLSGIWAVTLHEGTKCATWMVIVIDGQLLCQCKLNSWRGSICWMAVVVLDQIARTYCPTANPTCDQLAEFIVNTVLIRRNDAACFHIDNSASERRYSRDFDGGDANYDDTTFTWYADDYGSPSQPDPSVDSELGDSAALKGVLGGLRKIKQDLSPSLVRLSATGTPAPAIDDFFATATAAVESLWFSPDASRRRVVEPIITGTVLPSVLKLTPGTSATIALLGTMCTGSYLCLIHMCCAAYIPLIPLVDDIVVVNKCPISLGDRKQVVLMLHSVSYMLSLPYVFLFWFVEEHLARMKQERELREAKLSPPQQVVPVLLTMPRTRDLLFEATFDSAGLPTLPSDSPRGAINSGNCCYIISLLCAMTACHELCDVIQGVASKYPHGTSNTLTNLRDVLVEFSSSEHATSVANNIVLEFAVGLWRRRLVRLGRLVDLNKFVLGGSLRQQDVHEAFIAIFEECDVDVSAGLPEIEADTWRNSPVKVRAFSCTHTGTSTCAHPLHMYSFR
jgi:hypothetical protein